MSWIVPLSMVLFVDGESAGIINPLVLVLGVIVMSPTYTAIAWVSNCTPFHVALFAVLRHGA